MRTILLTILFALCTALPSSAQHLLIQDTKIEIPVPPKYVDSTRTTKREDFLYFKTKKIEELEKAGEFDEGIAFYGAYASPRTDRTDQEVFAQLFSAVYNQAKINAEGGKGESAIGDLNAKLVSRLVNSAGGTSIRTATLTSNEPTRKSFRTLIGYELIGVVTIPIYVENAFVFVKGKMVFFQNYRVAIDTNPRKLSKAIERDVTRTSKRLMTSIQKANR